MMGFQPGVVVYRLHHRLHRPAEERNHCLELCHDEQWKHSGVQLPLHVVPPLHERAKSRVDVDRWQRATFKCQQTTSAAHLPPGIIIDNRLDLFFSESFCCCCYCCCCRGGGGGGGRGGEMWR